MARLNLYNSPLKERTILITYIIVRNDELFSIFEKNSLDHLAWNFHFSKMANLPKNNSLLPHNFNIFENVENLKYIFFRESIFVKENKESFTLFWSILFLTRNLQNKIIIVH